MEKKEFDITAKPCKGLKDLCQSLGKEYRIISMDMERVIYRDFGNHFEIEVSRLNTNKKHPRGKIFIWKDKKTVIRTIRGIPKEQIADRLDEIASLMPVFERAYWTMEEAEKCTGCCEEQLISIARQNPHVVVAATSPMLFIRDKLVFCTRN